MKILDDDAGGASGMTTETAITVGGAGIFCFFILACIWAIFLRADIICLQLVKIDILDPLGGVLYTLIQFCSCWIYKIQVWRHLDLKDSNSEN